VSFPGTFGAESAGRSVADFHAAAVADEEWFLRQHHRLMSESALLGTLSGSWTFGLSRCSRLVRHWPDQRRRKLASAAHLDGLRATAVLAAVGGEDADAVAEDIFTRGNEGWAATRRRVPPGIQQPADLVVGDDIASGIAGNATRPAVGGLTT
jgi:hypothetical protein